MKGDILLLVGDLVGINSRSIMRISDTMREAGIEQVVLIDLPKGEAYLGDMAEERLREFHKLIHDILGEG